MNKNIKPIAIIFFLSFSIIFTYIGRNSLSFSLWYTTNVYPLLVTTIGWFFSIFPFSAVELLLYGLILFIFLSLMKGITKKSILPWLKNIACILSFLLFLYTFQCGINYHTLTFAEYSGFVKKNYTLEELTNLCEYLTVRLNELAPLVNRSEEGGTLLSSDVKKEAVLSMHNLGTIYPILSGYYPQPKPLLLSEILSYQHLSGVYSPFTIEANYNKDMPPYNIPFTICHELAHLKGFMREDEANFISYLACIHSANVDFSYSGYLLAWIYATNELNTAAPKSYENLKSTLEPLVFTDLKENNLFWAAYRGKTAEITTRINDSYLKANKQLAGVETYNEMVTLLISYYSSESFSSISLHR